MQTVIIILAPFECFLCFEPPMLVCCGSQTKISNLMAPRGTNCGCGDKIFEVFVKTKKKRRVEYMGLHPI